MGYRTFGRITECPSTVAGWFTNTLWLWGRDDRRDIEITSDGSQTLVLEMEDRELEIARKAVVRPVVVSGAFEVRTGVVSVSGGSSWFETLEADKELN